MRLGVLIFWMVTFKELQQQVAEQKKLLQSVANFGEELLNQTTFNGERYVGFSISHLNSQFLFPKPINKHFSVGSRFLIKQLPSLSPTVRCPSQEECCWRVTSCVLQTS